jgi:hypothetical protein
MQRVQELSLLQPLRETRWDVRCLQNDKCVKYWESIADKLSKAGWSLGWVSAVDSEGRTIWIVDAHRDDGQRFVVRADEKLTAFVELEAAIRAFESGALDVSDKFRHKKLWVGRYFFSGGKGYHESV